MGINITIDTFSGRPNPSWDINDSSQVQDLLDLFARSQHGLAGLDEGLNGLGYRGIHVRITSDVIPQGLPSVFKVGGGGALDPLTGAGIAERLLETMPVAPEGEGVEEGARAYPPEFKEWVRGEIRRHAVRGSDRTETTAPTETSSEEGEVDGQCPYDIAGYNPGYWNSPERQPYNNCYNYAVNLATNTFAQPGRAHGYTIPDTVTCEEVAYGAILDGLHVWGDCIPTGTRRYVVALVTGLIGGYRDYHWYRLHRGFWAHKPGQSYVRNTDDSGNVIVDPQICDRGGYTTWCGYMQVSDDTVIR